MKWLVDEQYPKATKIALVMCDFNTHTVASLYQTFKPEEALRIAQKLEIHYTPKHESWNDATMKDHVHMYVSIPPKESVSKVVGRINGKSSLMIFDRHPEYR